MASAVEKRIVDLHFRLTGGGMGFYNNKTRKFRDGYEDEPLYLANLKIVQDQLKRGKTASDLEEFIRQRYDAKERAPLLSDLLPKEEARDLSEQANLLEDGVAYQHPHLFEITNPSFYVTGETMVLRTPGKKRRRDSFTLRDVVHYYGEQVPRCPLNVRQHVAAVGAFRYFLKDARVDELLHAIDLASVESARLSRPCSALQVGNFLPDAKEEVWNRNGRGRE